MGWKLHLSVENTVGWHFDQHHVTIGIHGLPVHLAKTLDICHPVSRLDCSKTSTGKLTTEISSSCEEFGNPLVDHHFWKRLIAKDVEIWAKSLLMPNLRDKGKLDFASVEPTVSQVPTKCLWEHE